MGMTAVCFVGVSSGERRPPDAFRGQRVRALAGIGHPERFFRLLEELGAVVERHPLPDHAQPAQWLRTLTGDIPVLMTEKDAVKCGGVAGRHHWYLRVSAAIGPDDTARLMAIVEAALRHRK
jgi:tetraacyldisaccharide 4'-kinase